MKILLIDDNAELREFLALSLSEAGIEAVSVGDGANASNKANEEKFDAFVVDSFLGTTDGLALVSELRNTRHGKNTPVLLMSNIATSLARRMAQSAGCDEFLVKPFGQGQFVEQVRALSRGARR